MFIKPTSKTLNRIDTNSEYMIKYHNTVVLKFDKATKTIILKTGGWETLNTARAMTFGLEESGLVGIVECRDNKKEQGLFLTLGGNRFKIYDGMTICL